VDSSPVGGLGETREGRVRGSGGGSPSDSAAAGRLPVMASTAYRAAHAAQDKEGYSDHGEDDAEGLQDGDLGHETDDDQDDT
jgi:hypothetical protein